MKVNNLHIGFNRMRLLILVGLGLIILSSCSVKKFIPEDEMLYTGAELEINKDQKLKNFKKVESVLEEAIRPEPNSKFLGVRWGLYFLYKAQNNPSFITRFLNKKIGE